MIEYYMTSLQKIENSSDLMLPLPDELLKKLYWKEGDTIECSIDENGNINLVKLPNF